jgi:hypothetical protein
MRNMLDSTPPLDRPLLRLSGDDEDITPDDVWQAENGAPSPEDAIIRMIDKKARARKGAR